MIPDIGLIIGAYVITRMTVLLGLPDTQANIASKVLAVITILVTLVLGADLLMRGGSAPLGR